MGTVSHSSQDFECIISIVNQHIPCQMSALFLLRLMVLSPSIAESNSIHLVFDTLVDKLNVGLGAFSGVPSTVMALCSLSNLIGNDKAKFFIFANSLEVRLIGSALAYIGHERTELRQISTTLVYNFSLVCTSAKNLNGWCPPGQASVLAVNGV